MKFVVVDLMAFLTVVKRTVNKKEKYNLCIFKCTFYFQEYYLQHNSLDPCPTTNTAESYLFRRYCSYFNKNVQNSPLTDISKICTVNPPW